MLLRPSQLARYWELHPKTVYLWIKAGRLPAVKTPGDQYRVRPEDVPAFCAKNGLPVPPGLQPSRRRVVVIGADADAQRAMRRVLRGKSVDVTWFASAFDGLVAAAESPPFLVVVDGAAVDAEAAILALRRARTTRGVPVLAYHLTTAARIAKATRAGAAWAVGKDVEVGAALLSALEA
jgi:excisionase family DNA binding protein